MKKLAELFSTVGRIKGVYAYKDKVCISTRHNGLRALLDFSTPYFLYFGSPKSLFRRSQVR